MGHGRLPPAAEFGALSGSLALLLLLAAGVAQSAAPEYLSPSAVAAGHDGKLLYVAARTANRVLVVNAAKQEVTARFALPSPPGGLCLSPDGKTLYVTGAMPEGRVYVLSLPSGEIVHKIEVGHTPVSPVINADGTRLYVCNQFSNTISVVDLTKGTLVDTIKVGRQPVDAALTPDGESLLVANLLPEGPADEYYVAAKISIVDTASRALVKSVSLPTGTTAVRGIAISPSGRFAYAAHIRGHFQLHTIQLDRGWMSTNALSVIDIAKQELVNTVVLDDVDHGAANPWDIACTTDGQFLLVSHAGTHEISLIDRPALHAKLQGAPRVNMRPERLSKWHTALMPPDLTFMRGIRRRVKLKGKGPRGLAVSDQTVYAAEYFSDSLAVLDIGNDEAPEMDSIALCARQPLTEERRGEILFHDATHCFQQWQSCATCHPSEGRPDALNWDLLNDGIDNPRNTKSLLLAHQTPPAMITGVRARAEIAVRAGIEHILFSEVSETDAAAVDAYLKSLEPVPSPYLVDGGLSPAAGRGKAVYSKAGCPACHPQPLGTDLNKAAVGTGRGEEKDRQFDTPALVEIWRTAPYLNDGRANTIKDVLTVHNPDDAHGVTTGLGAQEIADLEEYVLSL
jgi:YVTN family beta-propeller protein